MRTVVSPGGGRVIINGIEEWGTTTHMALRMFQKGIESRLDVRHDTSPFPIAAGFGTGGSGSWGLGASFIFGGTRDYFKLALYAHEAEIKMKTGLTVASISVSPTGAGILLEPGPREGRSYNPLYLKKRDIASSS